jgi:hypothetical protein
MTAILPPQRRKIEEASFWDRFSVSVRDLCDTGPKPVDGGAPGLVLHAGMGRMRQFLPRCRGGYPFGPLMAICVNLRTLGRIYARRTGGPSRSPPFPR